MVEPAAYIELVEARLQNAGVETTHTALGGADVLVGYRPRFRLEWMATKLNLFTVVAGVEEVTREGLKQLTHDALDFAIARKGRLRGLQTGVAAIPVLVGARVAPDAASYAEAEMLRRWSAFAWPTAVDLNARSVYRHQGRVLVGGIYASWIRSQTALALPDPQPVAD